MDEYWADASTAADGVTWRDSSGAVVDISTWWSGYPKNQSNYGMGISAAIGYAYDYPNWYSPYVGNKIWCATVVH